jgi:hypothetical protein
MAFLIPENVRSDKTIAASHRRVTTALAVGLDDATTVWYEPPFDPTGDRPHFVVLDPSRGIVVVQVIEQEKDDADEVLGHWQGRLRVRRAGQDIEIADPLASARAFADALSDRLRASTATAHVPVGAMAALPFLTRAEADAHELGALFDLDATLPKDTIAAINSGDETLLPRAIGRLLGGVLDDDLDDVTMQIVRAIIHPDVLIGTPPPSPDVAEPTLLDVAALDDIDVVKVMDRQQERMAKGLGSGHRVIRGVAGSGKTLVLVHRARMLATLLPGKRILVTCYTKSLASVLEAQLADLPNVEVINLDRLMVSAVRSAGMLAPSATPDWDRLPTDALEAMQQRPLARYRAVMVDEAQDFATEALQFCVELLETDEPGVEGDLVIVADSAQNIFRRNFRWKDAGINAQGRTKILRTNYRNTRQILEFAYRFLTKDQERDAEPDLDDETAIIPAESSEREGSDPRVVPVVTSDREQKAIVDQVAAWYRPDLRPRSIAVLLPRHHGAQAIVERLRAADIPVFWTHETSKAKAEIGSSDEAVVVSTIASAKGLEFPQVVVAGLAQSVPHEDVRKLLYVAFTRAIDELTVVADRTSPFAADLAG